MIATVVSAGQAGLADTARNVGLDGDAIANLEVGNGRVDGDDITGRFVAQDVVALDNHGTNAAGVPKVNIGAADTSASDSNADLTRLEALARLDALRAGLGRSYPEVMVRVGVDSNVGFERRLCTVGGGRIDS